MKKKLIKNTGLTQRQIDTKVVAKDLGAEKVGIKIDTKQGPISLFSLRQFLISRIEKITMVYAFLTKRKYKSDKEEYRKHLYQKYLKGTEDPRD